MDKQYDNISEKLKYSLIHNRPGWINWC